MASKESDVRSVIVSAIQADWSALGFDIENGNVKEYLLSWEADEKQTEYLYTDISGDKELRAWGVQVTTETEPWHAMKNIVKRFFDIQIQGYYDKQRVRINEMIDGARTIRESIKDLGNTLSSNVQQVTEVSITAPEIIEVPSIGDVLIITMNYKAEMTNPDF